MVSPFGRFGRPSPCTDLVAHGWKMPRTSVGGRLLRRPQRDRAAFRPTSSDTGHGRGHHGIWKETDDDNDKARRPRYGRDERYRPGGGPGTGPTRPPCLPVLEE